MKLEEIHSLVGKTYFAFWSIALKELLGWSNAQIEDWTEQFRDSIHDENDLLFHSLPGQYIAHLCLTDKLKKDLTDRNALEPTLREISDCMNEYIYPELENGIGWDKARKRIDDLIFRLGLM